MDNKKKIYPTDIVLPLLSVILTFGVMFVFHACEPHEDGSFMSCHWAQEVVLGLGSVMTVISGLHSGAVQPRTKIGISLSLIPVEIFTAVVPGGAISLCMMKDMRCHTTMRPAVVIICVLMLVTTVIDIYLNNKRKGAAE